MRPSMPPDGYALYGVWNKDSYVGAAIQMDHKLLVSTGILNGTDSDVGVLRYNPDGGLGHHLRDGRGFCL